ncbi:uncharacterized protein BO97DRAFT_72744 [Aspergillus homomorphus CBS 101889]|uniref:Uncharacterized protein n=1 Tax=Aspergillus homomorphus (strain CBS 101889) TaxID=1450537 RepID=A0A395I8T1_ASPHC|nr:hypothetical protein BO97DRAFT_72744 [Aspergillus homomorphus CBS 101889]RAL16680.1 hypothetical protein BO97DRAFT_72744 [Aspergillus homomorphus CBS 101889]
MTIGWSSGSSDYHSISIRCPSLKQWFDLPLIMNATWRPPFSIPPFLSSCLSTARSGWPGVFFFFFFFFFFPFFSGETV